MESQIQQHLKNTGTVDEIGQDEQKWMHDEALNWGLYSIAQAFGPDKDAQWIREDRVGMGAPTMLDCFPWFESQEVSGLYDDRFPRIPMMNWSELLSMSGSIE